MSLLSEYFVPHHPALSSAKYFFQDPNSAFLLYISSVFQEDRTP